MKNLLIYINPDKTFSGESATTVKIQLENSLRLGWKPEDILLVTNFPYEYAGIKSIVLSDRAFFAPFPVAAKTTAILEMFRAGLIERDTLYWTHDLDNYQLVEFPESEIGIADNQIGVCKYPTRKDRWGTGSIFFRHGSADLFEIIVKEMYDRTTTDEWAITKLVEFHKNIRERIVAMNTTYNFLYMELRQHYKLAIKPIRTVHFHPSRPLYHYNESMNGQDFFMYGKNKLNMVLMPQGLIDIFHKHGIK